MKKWNSNGGGENEVEECFGRIRSSSSERVQKTDLKEGHRIAFRVAGTTPSPLFFPPPHRSHPPCPVLQDDLQHQTAREEARASKTRSARVSPIWVLSSQFISFIFFFFFFFSTSERISNKTGSLHGCLEITIPLVRIGGSECRGGCTQ